MSLVSMTFIIKILFNFAFLKFHKFINVIIYFDILFYLMDLHLNKLILLRLFAY